MQADEPRHQGKEVITPGEDLSVLGLDQLKAREATLLEELERTRAIAKTKQVGRAAADALFKT